MIQFPPVFDLAQFITELTTAGAVLVPVLAIVFVYYLVKEALNRA